MQAELEESIKVLRVAQVAVKGLPCFDDCMASLVENEMRLAELRHHVRGQPASEVM